MAKQNISDNTLKDTYSLAFTKITSAIIYHYRHSIGGLIELVIKPKSIIVLRDGKIYESLRLDQLDSMFKSIDVQRLRKNLRKI